MATRINGVIGKNIENLKDIQEARKREEYLKVNRQKPEERPFNQTEVVEVSSQKLVERAVNRTQAMPEIREERVAEIRARVQAGTYRVSNREVARAMIANLLNEIA